MILLLLFFSADFTYEAPAGAWLDYARTTSLSEDRFLVVEHQGQKGQYDLGARQKILDGEGLFLYDIPPAENAWTVRNGLFGDPDTYIFQARDQDSWTIWNPAFGAKTLSIGDGVEAGMPLPLRTPHLSFTKILDDGRQLLFFSKVPYTREGRLYAQTLIEILVFNTDPETFFGSPTYKPASYRKIHLDQDFSYALDGKKLALFDPIEGMKGLAMFFQMDLDDESEQIALIDIPTAHPVFAMQVEKGFLAYSFEEGLAFEKVGAKKPLFVLKDSDREKPGYTDLLAFANAVGKGVISENQGRVSYILDKQLVVFDTNDLSLQFFQVNNTLNGYLSPQKNREMFCDHRRFTVKAVQRANLQNPTVALRTVSAGPFAPQ